MTTRRSYFAKTLAVVVAAACGLNRLRWPKPNRLKPSRMKPSPAKRNRMKPNRVTDDVVSRDSVWHDPDVPAQGNPDGDVTFVEYFDYQCPVCRQVHPQLSRAVRDDGKGAAGVQGLADLRRRVRPRRANRARRQVSGKVCAGSRGVVHREGRHLRKPSSPSCCRRPESIRRGPRSILPPIARRSMPCSRAIKRRPRRSDSWARRRSSSARSG